MHKVIKQDMFARKVIKQGLNRNNNNPPESRPLLDRGSPHESYLSLESRESSIESFLIPSDDAATSWRDETVLWLDGSVYTHLWDCVDAVINLGSLD